MKKRVFIVDDSPVMAHIIKKVLKSTGYDVIGKASCGENAITEIQNLKPDLVTLDYKLPDITGLDVVEQLQTSELETKFVMVSSEDLDEILDEKKELGVVSYLKKPFNFTKFINTIDEQLAPVALEEELV